MNSQVRSLIGLFGVIILAMTSSLNEQVSSQGLGDIMGAVGMSHDPASWFSSLYTTAEVIGMGVAPWLSVTFGLRRFALFTVILMGCATVPMVGIDNVSLLYGLRVFQGLSGGFAVPLLMTTALRVLGPPIRLYGLAAYALTATCFPYLSTALAGLWTDLVEWQFIFFQVIPFGFLAVSMIGYGLPKEPTRLERFRVFDWRGFIFILVGFSALSTMLLQGDRLDWFNSPVICVLALCASVCLPLLVVNEWFHPEPFFRFQLLGRRNFLYGVTALLFFVVISISSSAIPGIFLSHVAGYRPEQTYLVTLEVAVLQFLFLPLMAIILNQKWVDARVISALGMFCLFIACCGDSFATSIWNRNQFYVWQFFQALGASMVVMPLLMMSTNMVHPSEGPYASGLVNCPRGMMQVVGAWLVQLVLRWRGRLHSDRLADHLGVVRYRLFQGSTPVQQFPTPLTPQGTLRFPGSVKMLAGQMHRQVAVLVIEDLFLVVSGLIVALMVCLIVIPVRTYPPRIALVAQSSPKS